MTSNRQTFQQFLYEKSQPGRFDSVGEFQLSGAHALQKLTQHSIADPAHWVLKIVQAAVAGEAKEIRFRCFSRSTQADLIMDTLPSRDDFSGALLRLEAALGTCLGELTMGLRALMGKDYLRILWCETQQTTGFIWNGQELMPIEPRPWTEEQSRLRIEIPVGILSFSARAEESKLLEERCRWCPIPLILDGRIINTSTNLPRSQFKRRRHGTGSPRYLAAGWFGPSPTQKPLWGEMTQPKVTFCQDQLRANLSFCYWSQPKPEKHKGGFCIFASYNDPTGAVKDLVSNYGTRAAAPLQEKFRLHATRFGVTCGGYESDEFGLGGEIVSPGEHLATDLVELKLNLDEQWYDEIKSLADNLFAVVKEVSGRLKECKPKPTVKDAAELVRNLAVGVVGGAVTATVGIASGGILSLASPFVPLYFGWLTDLDDPALLERLPNWLHDSYARLKNNLPPKKWREVEL